MLLRKNGWWSSENVFFGLCFSWKLGKYYQQKDDLFLHHLRIILSVTNTAGQMSKFSKATFLSPTRQPYCFTNLSLTSKSIHLSQKKTPIRVFHDWRAHGLMVLRGKHGNSSNFADPPHTNRLEDKSSELKHVCGPVVIFCLYKICSSLT